MKKNKNGKVWYEFGPAHNFSFPEEALIQYADVIIEKYGKQLTLDQLNNIGIMWGEYYGTLMFQYQDELSWHFPKRNLYSMYKKRCKK